MTRRYEARYELRHEHMKRREAIKRHAVKVSGMIAQDGIMYDRHMKACERSMKVLSGTEVPPTWMDYHRWRIDAVAQELSDEIEHYGRPLMSSSMAYREMPTPADPWLADPITTEPETDAAQNATAAQCGKEVGR